VKGVPFVGQAGKLLTALLDTAHLTRQDVYITNNVRCRPPDNRDPLPRESEACQTWLDLEMGLVTPKVIVTLGKVAARRWFPHEKRSVAGTARAVDGRIILATFHPAAALRNQNLVSQIVSDLRRAKRYATDP
jgi:uracil-DNA glycosylase family 4